MNKSLLREAHWSKFGPRLGCVIAHAAITSALILGRHAVSSLGRVAINFVPIPDYWKVSTSLKFYLQISEEASIFHSPGGSQE